MDRKTLLAVILSTVVLAIGFYFQGVFFPPEEAPLEAPSESVSQENAEPADTNTSSAGADERESAVERPAEFEGRYDFNGRASRWHPKRNHLPSTTPVEYVDPGFMRVIINPRGANITSVQLLSHTDNGEPLDFFFGESDRSGLTMTLGGIDGELIDPVFNLRRGEGDRVFEFYQTLVIRGYEDQPFELLKRYTFAEGEYLFELDVELRNSVNDFVPLNFDGDAYTLSIGPQIAPAFEELAGRRAGADFRKFSYLDGDRRRDITNIATATARAWKN
jgi:YidC/Oxa1 family membrane protein insertase